jgi:bifunctional non-homologous end joining protein LigD
MKPTVEAMLCQSGTESDLDNPHMVASLKFDGTRVWAGKVDGEPFVKNRKNIDYTDRLMDIVEALRQMPHHDFIIDGEAVYYDKNGRSLFEGSQRRCSTQNLAKQQILRIKYPLVIEGYDIISVDGRDLRNMSWKSRDYLLSELLKDVKINDHGAGLRYVQNYYDEDKRKIFNEVVARGEEGVILKDMHSQYVGKRSRSWLKVKKMYSERCRVVGYTEGSGKRLGLFGSLILAQPNDQGILEYCGKVGSGFDDAELRRVYKILAQNESESRQVDARDSNGRPVPYTPVNTSLEITVKFYETSKNGVFRFPSILKDRGVNLIHYNDPRIKATPKAMDLKDLLRSLSK